MISPEQTAEQLEMQAEGLLKLAAQLRGSKTKKKSLSRSEREKQMMEERSAELKEQILGNKKKK